MATFSVLPNVLIQDPKAGHAYFIEAERLRDFKMSAEQILYIDDGAITFTIPDDELVEATPPFNSAHTERPHILIQMLAEQTSYLLSYEQLQAFRVEQPDDYGGYGISFVIPSGNEFLEDLSPVQHAMLQVGEVDCGGPIFCVSVDDDAVSVSAQ